MQQDLDMRFVRRHNRSGGVTLLLTLMILVVLATVVVQFQADTMLHLRTAGYRQQRLECQYAAESGVILGSAIIKQKFFEGSQERALNLQSSAVDPNALLSELTEDPNALPETDELLLEQASSRPNFMIDRKEFKIGRADVVVEIHDENAKFPMVWFLSTPYQGGRQVRKLDDSLDIWSEAVGANYEQSSQAQKLLGSLAGKVNVPRPMIIIDLSSRDEDIQSSGDRRTPARRRSTRRRMTYSQRLEEAKKRHEAMGVFADLWCKEMSANEDYEDLRRPCDDDEYTLSNYLSIWGADAVNINTASEELIYSVFEPFGVTKEMARGIVERRREKPFTNTGEITQALQLGNRNLSIDLSRLFVTEADTYSLHVTATLGRAQARMQGGLFKHRGRMYNLSVIAGDG
ncbi:MAG: general secretion pathway protein GspK [Sedimentisphaerales bacterium]|nr:general secretion pathway protein GspK [Sedimentisphaerales bacterium]